MKEFPEAELIAEELKQLGCEVSQADSISGGYDIVIFDEKAFTADGLIRAVSKPDAEGGTAITAVVLSYTEPEDLPASEGRLLLFRRPFGIGPFVSSVMLPLRSSMTEEDKLTEQVGSMLEVMGFPAGKTGSECLRDSVVVFLMTPPGKIRLKTEIYPKAAEMNGKTVAAVDKAVARIIEEFWQKAPETLLREVFGRSCPTDKPLYPKEIISRLAWYFRSRPFDELTERLSGSYHTS